MAPIMPPPSHLEEPLTCTCGHRHDMYVYMYMYVRTYVCIHIHICIGVRWARGGNLHHDTARAVASFASRGAAFMRLQTQAR